MGSGPGESVAWCGSGRLHSSAGRSTCSATRRACSASRARSAAAEGVDELNLRTLNKHVDIAPGLILKIPPKRIVAVDPPEVTTLRDKTPTDHDRGFVPVETTPITTTVSAPPKAHLVHPATTRETPPATTAKPKSGKTYVVQSGDSIWRIANRCKISEDALMRANGISDARKMKTGMKLVIPKG